MGGALAGASVRLRPAGDKRQNFSVAQVRKNRGKNDDISYIVVKSYPRCSRLSGCVVAVLDGFTRDQTLYLSLFHAIVVGDLEARLNYHEP